MLYVNVNVNCKYSTERNSCIPLTLKRDEIEAQNCFSIAYRYINYLEYTLNLIIKLAFQQEY